jgi:hypothetical protein
LELELELLVDDRLLRRLLLCLLLGAGHGGRAVAPLLDEDLRADLGFGRVIVIEIEVLDIFVNMV